MNGVKRFGRKQNEVRNVRDYIQTTEAKASIKALERYANLCCAGESDSAHHAYLEQLAREAGITTWRQDSQGGTQSPFTDEFTAVLANNDKRIQQATAIVNDLNKDQKSPTSWAPPETTPATVACWTSRHRWLQACLCFFATAAGDHYRYDGRRLRISLQSLIYVAAAMADCADGKTGRGCTASNQTIATRASRHAGKRISPDTVTRAVATLVKAGFVHEAVRGRYMTKAERLAARLHHGGRQIRCASTRHLTMNKRNAQYRVIPDLPRRGKYLIHLLKKVDGYSHARTRARGHKRPDHRQKKKNRSCYRAAIPPWAWKLTDQLVRVEPDDHGRRGPMAAWLPVNTHHPSGMPTRQHRGAIARVIARYATPGTTAAHIVQHMDRYRAQRRWDSTIPNKPAAYLTKVLKNALSR